MSEEDYLLTPKDVFDIIRDYQGIFNVLDDEAVISAQIELGTEEGDKLERLWRQLEQHYKKTNDLAERIWTILDVPENYR